MNVIDGGSTKYSKFDYNTRGMSPSQEEEALARAEARKIGPFCFDVDNDIETEVLVNE